MNVIQAGDTLIVALSPAVVSPEMAEAVKGRFAAELPGVGKIIVVSGVSGLDVYRPNVRETEDS